jgi:hypothetical protein
VDLYDWLLFLHVLSAGLAVGGLASLWALIIGTRPAGPLLPPRPAARYGVVAGTLVGIGMTGAVVFGIWLAIHVDGYELWDGWILASLIIWAVAGWAGGVAGRAYAEDPVGRRRSAMRFHAISSIGVLVILVLMIWKPGA